MVCGGAPPVDQQQPSTSMSGTPVVPNVTPTTSHGANGSDGDDSDIIILTPPRQPSQSQPRRQRHQNPRPPLPAPQPPSDLQLPVPPPGVTLGTPATNPLPNTNNNNNNVVQHTTPVVPSSNQTVAGGKVEMPTSDMCIHRVNRVNCEILECLHARTHTASPTAARTIVVVPPKPKPTARVQPMNSVEVPEVVTLSDDEDDIRIVAPVPPPVVQQPVEEEPLADAIVQDPRNLVSPVFNRVMEDADDDVQCVYYGTGDATVSNGSRRTFLVPRDPADPVPPVNIPPTVPRNVGIVESKPNVAPSTPVVVQVVATDEGPDSEGAEASVADQEAVAAVAEPEIVEADVVVDQPVTDVVGVPNVEEADGIATDQSMGVTQMDTADSTTSSTVKTAGTTATQEHLESSDARPSTAAEDAPKAAESMDSIQSAAKNILDSVTEAVANLALPDFSDSGIVVDNNMSQCLLSSSTERAQDSHRDSSEEVTTTLDDVDPQSLNNGEEGTTADSGREEREEEPAPTQVPIDAENKDVELEVDSVEIVEETEKMIEEVTLPSDTVGIPVQDSVTRPTIQKSMPIVVEPKVTAEPVWADDSLPLEEPGAPAVVSIPETVTIVSTVEEPVNTVPENAVNLEPTTTSSAGVAVTLATVTSSISVEENIVDDVVMEEDTDDVPTLMENSGKHSGDAADTVPVPMEIEENEATVPNVVKATVDSTNTVPVSVENTEATVPAVTVTPIYATMDDMDMDDIFSPSPPEAGDALMIIDETQEEESPEPEVVAAETPSCTQNAQLQDAAEYFDGSECSLDLKRVEEIEEVQEMDKESESPPRRPPSLDEHMQRMFAKFGEDSVFLLNEAMKNLLEDRECSDISEEINVRRVASKQGAFSDRSLKLLDRCSTRDNKKGKRSRRIRDDSNIDIDYLVSAVIVDGERGELFLEEESLTGKARISTSVSSESVTATATKGKSKEKERAERKSVSSDVADAAAKEKQRAERKRRMDQFITPPWHRFVESDTDTKYLRQKHNREENHNNNSIKVHKQPLVVDEQKKKMDSKREEEERRNKLNKINDEWMHRTEEKMTGDGKKDDKWLSKRVEEEKREKEKLKKEIMKEKEKKTVRRVTFAPGDSLHEVRILEPHPDSPQTPDDPLNLDKDEVIISSSPDGNAEAVLCEEGLQFDAPPKAHSTPLSSPETTWVHPHEEDYGGPPRKRQRWTSAKGPNAYSEMHTSPVSDRTFDFNKRPKDVSHLPAVSLEERTSPREDGLPRDPRPNPYARPPPSDVQKPIPLNPMGYVLIDDPRIHHPDSKYATRVPLLDVPLLWLGRIPTRITPQHRDVRPPVAAALPAPFDVCSLPQNSVYGALPISTIPPPQLLNIVVPPGKGLPQSVQNVQNNNNEDDDDDDCVFLAEVPCSKSTSADKLAAPANIAQTKINEVNKFSSSTIKTLPDDRLCAHPPPPPPPPLPSVPEKAKTLEVVKPVSSITTTLPDDSLCAHPPPPPPPPPVPDIPEKAKTSERAPAKELPDRLKNIPGAGKLTALFTRDIENRAAAEKALAAKAAEKAAAEKADEEEARKRKETLKEYTKSTGENWCEPTPPPVSEPSVEKSKCPGRVAPKIVFNLGSVFAHQKESASSALEKAEQAKKKKIEETIRQDEIRKQKAEEAVKRRKLEEKVVVSSVDDIPLPPTIPSSGNVPIVYVVSDDDMMDDDDEDDFLPVQVKNQKPNNNEESQRKKDQQFGKMMSFSEAEAARKKKRPSISDAEMKLIMNGTDKEKVIRKERRTEVGQEEAKKAVELLKTVCGVDDRIDSQYEKYADDYSGVDWVTKLQEHNKAVNDYVTEEFDMIKIRDGYGRQRSPLWRLVDVSREEVRLPFPKQAGLYWPVLDVVDGITEKDDWHSLVVRNVFPNNSFEGVRARRQYLAEPPQKMSHRDRFRKAVNCMSSRDNRDTKGEKEKSMNRFEARYGCRRAFTQESHEERKRIEQEDYAMEKGNYYERKDNMSVGQQCKRNVYDGYTMHLNDKKDDKALFASAEWYGPAEDELVTENNNKEYFGLYLEYLSKDISNSSVQNSTYNREDRDDARYVSVITAAFVHAMRDAKYWIEEDVLDYDPKRKDLGLQYDCMYLCNREASEFRMLVYDDMMDPDNQVRYSKLLTFCRLREEEKNDWPIIYQMLTHIFNTYVPVSQLSLRDHIEKIMNKYFAPKNHRKDFFKDFRRRAEIADNTRRQVERERRAEKEERRKRKDDERGVSNGR